MKKVSFFSALFLTACVTINIYFPAAAAEQVADEIIKGIQTEQSIEQQTEDVLQPQSKVDGLQRVVYLWIDRSLGVVISPAHAAGANLSVDTAGIRRLRAAMRTRFSALKPFYTKGLIGIKEDGFLLARGATPLKDRNRLKKLVAAENKDRGGLYQAIANANGHPDWFAQIKATFATRWISNAKKGWWYQTAKGNWKKK